MSGGLAEIRGWLVKGESEAGWLGMCRILEGLEDSEREMLVLYVAQHTKGWGESIRRPLYEWWEKHRRGEATVFEGLVGDWSKYAWEEGKVAGEVREVASVEGMRVRWIPAGTFLLGEGAVYFQWKPSKARLTRGYWMMETTVTQGQYEVVMGENPSYFKEAGLDAPVNYVSWYDVAVFANKLSVLEGVSESFVGSGEEMDGVGNKESDYIGSKGWRLPTEAEWEYAFRAGAVLLPCVNLNKIAWYDDNSDRRIHPVGQKEPNAWGLYDMLGNVSEWCYDWYDHAGYEGRELFAVLNAEAGCYDWYDRAGYKVHLQAVTDPVRAATGASRVHRGGCLDSNARATQPSFRNCDKPTHRAGHLGFRLVRSGS